jgi:N-acyl-D-amino-acid deacylase
VLKKLEIRAISARIRVEVDGKALLAISDSVTQMLKHVIYLSLFLLSANHGLFAQKQSAQAKYDLVVRHARVLDGTGNPWFYADVGVKGDRIGRIGRISETGKREIDGTGLYLTPGFIDMHSHSDYTLLVDGNAESKIRQGVTTEILGEASSAAPRCPAAQPEDDAATGPYGVTPDWSDFRGYFARLKKQGIAVNIASYVGAGRIRLCGMGADDRAPSPQELERMRSLVADAMKQGAIGLASGLIYPPNSFAKTDELIELAKVASQYGGIYTSHIRNEGGGVMKAVDEAIAIGEGARLPVHILHIKVAGENNWGRMKELIDHIQAARDRGIEISADQYPYIASATGLSTRLPEWTLDGGIPKLVERLGDSAARTRILDEMRKTPYNWDHALIAMVQKPENKQFEGKSIAQAAQIRGISPEDTTLDLLQQENGTVRMIYFSMSENDVRYAMKVPWISVGSDGTAFKPEGVLGQGKPHPRSYGTFTRVLSTYVRDEKVISLEEAVRKMTSLAAQQARIPDRGVIREGAHADLLLFDLQKIKEHSTFADPHHLSEGMSYVIVNGKIALENGQTTGVRSGQIILGAGAR